MWRTRRRRLVSLALFMMILVVGGAVAYLMTLKKPSLNKQSVYSPNFFGMGEPLTLRHVWEGINITKAFENLRSLGVTRLREWIWMRFFLTNQSTLNLTFRETLNLVISEARASNITIMGMSHDFPSWMTGIRGDPQAVPRRNMTTGSDYLRFLEIWRESWKTLAQSFLNITLWEIGNEFNHDPFLHPQGFDRNITNSPRFSIQEKADITTDLLYYGSMGIHEGNPNARTALGGLAPVPDINGIGDFLKLIYVNIKSGQWPSTDSDDYFQVACWHPYLPVEPTESNWVNPNRAIHNIMKSHGDDDKRVVFSEFGYSDNGTVASQQNVAKYLVKAFRLARDYFQWLDTIYWFRLIEPKTISEDNPAGYGLIDLDWTWKPAACAYRTLHLLSLIAFSPVEHLLNPFQSHQKWERSVCAPSPCGVKPTRV